MTKLTAVFDGQVLRPDSPLELAPNTRVRLILEPTTDVVPKASSFLRVARELELDGPPDWSERLDDYLYGDSPLPM
ncbi:MAG TPA: hypothetical protein VN783_07640 [Thermoanaerobaculia bacterium]|nr:hypothetical protein [Thermoanaerobaculia bacterium]